MVTDIPACFPRKQIEGRQQMKKLVVRKVERIKTSAAITSSGCIVPE